MLENTTESLKDAIRVDAGQLRSHIDEAVRSSVEETLNGLLDAEADQICGAVRYQRSAERVDTPSWALRAPVGDQGRPGDAQSAETA